MREIVLGDCRHRECAAKAEGEHNSESMPLFGPKKRQKTQVNQGQDGLKNHVFSVNSCVVLSDRAFFYVAFSLYLKRMKIRHMFTSKK